MTAQEIAALLRSTHPELVSFLLQHVTPLGEWEPHGGPQGEQHLQYANLLVYLDLLYRHGPVYRPSLIGHEVIAILATQEVGQ